MTKQLFDKELIALCATEGSCSREDENPMVLARIYAPSFIFFVQGYIPESELVCGVELSRKGIWFIITPVAVLEEQGGQRDATFTPSRLEDIDEKYFTL